MENKDNFSFLVSALNTFKSKYPDNIIFTQLFTFDVIKSYILVLFDRFHKEFGRWELRQYDYVANEKAVKEIREALDKLVWKVQLTCDSGCAGDEHEEFYYPRKGFKSKPKLKKGTVLKVIERWKNFYGEYYRCEHENGTYDIPVGNASFYSGIPIYK